MYDPNEINILRDKMSAMESERLRLDADIAELRARLVEEQTANIALRSRIDITECHLRDARQTNARLHSKVQEYEAREFM